MQVTGIGVAQGDRPDLPPGSIAVVIVLATTGLGLALGPPESPVGPTVFYATPVFYDAASLERVAWLRWINPMVHVVDAHRAALLEDSRRFHRQGAIAGGRPLASTLSRMSSSHLTSRRCVSSSSR